MKEKIIHFANCVCKKEAAHSEPEKSGTSEWKSQICQVLEGVGNSFYFKNLCKCDDCNIINYLGGGREGEWAGKMNTHVYTVLTLCFQTTL